MVTIFQLKYVHFISQLYPDCTHRILPELDQNQKISTWTGTGIFFILVTRPDWNMEISSNSVNGLDQNQRIDTSGTQNQNCGSGYPEQNQRDRTLQPTWKHCLTLPVLNNSPVRSICLCWKWCGLWRGESVSNMCVLESWLWGEK